MLRTFSGRWSGVADTTDEGSTKRYEQQSFEVKVEGGKLTAVQLGKYGKPGAALQIQQDGAKFNVYRLLDFESVEHLRWKLDLTDGKLVDTNGLRAGYSPSPARFSIARNCPRVRMSEDCATSFPARS